MNKYFVYIISTLDSIGLHVGYTKDIAKAVKFYQMPSLVYTPNEFNQLVYIEGSYNETEAKERFEKINKMNREKKEALIEFQNPDWIKLIPGENIEI